MVFALFLLDTYVLATIFLFRTGSLGNTLHEWTLGTLGGSVIVILLYVAYLSLSWLLGFRVPKAWRQSMGTIALFLCCTLFLGLYRLSGIVSGIDLLQPGDLGLFLAGFLLGKIGPLGAIFSGFAGICIAMCLYGVLSKKVFDHMGTMFSKFKKTVEPSSFSEGVTKQADNTDQEKPKENPPLKPSPSTDRIIIPESITEDAISTEEDIKTKSPDPDLRFPVPLEIFGEPDDYSFNLNRDILDKQGKNIIATLDEFGVSAELAETVIGPTVIQYRLQLAPGIKVSRVSGLANDLAVSLAVPSLRVEAPISGKTYIGIEIPNPERKPVNLRTVLEHPSFQESDNDLSIPVGVGVDGRHLTIGLEKMPHLLVAGTTGSGKSVFVSCCITALCSRNRPEDLWLLLIDPKRVEMKLF